MAIVMTKVITQNVDMMVETAVDHASILTIVHTALALVILLVIECQMRLLEMVTAMMR